MAATNLMVVLMISDPTGRTRPYDFSAPVAPEAKAFEDALFDELVKTTAFQRLKSVRFLGGIDYLLVRSPNAARGNIRHTRYQHSLGVARLSLLYADLSDLAFSDRRHVYTAALLHDIGHAPLSHSLEPVFKETFGIEHHKATADIVSGRVPLGREVYETLRTHGVDVERVLAIITGHSDHCDGFFSGPINFDTIEGILRSLTYAKPDLNIPKPDDVVEASFWRCNPRHRTTVDELWLCKDLAYQSIIHSTAGILADYACQYFMRKNLNKLRSADYYSTESQLLRKLPGLVSLLRSSCFRSDISRIISAPIRYTARRFFIEPDADFFERDDSARYRQIRTPSVLIPNHLEAARVQREPAWEVCNDGCDQARKEAL